MKKLATALLSILCLSAFADPGDTVIVQTFTWDAQNNTETAYDSPGRRWFVFPPDDGTSYQKILMYHNLRCFSDGTAGGLGFPCGEWDYLTYNYLFDHTGLMDSDLVQHPHYLANNQDFETFAGSIMPYSNVQQYYIGTGNVLALENAVESTIGDGLETSNYPFKTSVNEVRSQYLWRVDELTAAGMTAGDIGAIRLTIDTPGAATEWLKIKMQHHTADTLSGIINSGWVTYYAWNPSPYSAGEQEYQFVVPFAWNGVEHIVVEISNDNVLVGDDNIVLSDNTQFNSAAHAEGVDRYARFSWYDEVKVPAGAFAQIDDQVTISFWLRGDENAQPLNSTVFEGVNAANQRVLNSHLPWGNGRVYWDAGQDGGYDRIDKQASEPDYEGVWNHWAFTKDTGTGIMNIYLNGVLWHTGSDKDNSMAGIVKFSIGAATGWSNYYEGDIDEFRIWDTALEAGVIQEWMFRDLDDSHPSYSSLVAYYKFNEADGNPVTDHSGNEFHATPHGSVSRVKYLSDELFRNASVTTARPQITFVQGDFTIEQIAEVYELEFPVAPVAVSEWVVDGNAVIIDNVSYYYPQGYSYTFDPNGVIVDSTLVDASVEITNDILTYYNPPFEVIDRYELGRYITPYGINLTLGNDGWTWVYDVTDFAPLLRDSVELQAGNWQELLDLKFAFIEGTPSRDVNRIEHLWNGNWSLNGWNTTIAPITVPFEEDDAMAKVITTATGHGFGTGNNCAEFCDNMHSLVVNGDAEWTWQIMQECADNSLYPQGGTWIYDRAGWCPGMPGRTQEFDVSEWVEDGQVTLDYDIQEDPYGNYVFESYLITYGDFNYNVDVEIQEIVAPSTFKLNSRVNPMCNKPQIRIRNVGAQTISSCTFTYGVAGSEMQTYEWTGELKPFENEVVELEYMESVMWIGDEETPETFEVTVSNPNGVDDENPSNNFSQSTFYRPPTYTYGTGDDDDNRLILWHVSNSAYWETSYTLYDMAGNVVYERDDFSAANTTYRDTIQLNAGCYLFHLKDSGDDGLQFFANNDGNGSMRLKKVGSSVLENFETDFGKEIKHYFYWQTDLVSTEELDNSEVTLTVFPNPTSGWVNLKMVGMGANVIVEVFDMQGRRIGMERLTGSGHSRIESLDFTKYPPGMYQLRVIDNQYAVTRSVVLER
ncbi:MAG: T9SS type A sorting domain-containing protein [Flavobacteriales bacterium]|nr:T9SS type A sorting domain-containing protein [Flavobacteriales bacterium]